MDKFDERQLWLRGNIFKHMFMITAGLLSLNICLAKLDIVWADIFYSNMIILFAGAVNIEIFLPFFKSSKNFSVSSK